MNRFLTRPGLAAHARGRINTVAAVTLALAAIVGVGATLAFSQHASVAPAAAPVSAGDPDAVALTHALPISASAETYSDSNPQPPTF